MASPSSSVFKFGTVGRTARISALSTPILGVVFGGIAAGVWGSMLVHPVSVTVQLTAATNLASWSALMFLSIFGLYGILREDLLSVTLYFLALVCIHWIFDLFANTTLYLFVLREGGTIAAVVIYKVMNTFACYLVWRYRQELYRKSLTDLKPAGGYGKA